jgi:hypothetical protein
MPAEDIMVVAQWKAHQVAGPFYTANNGFKIAYFTE